MVGLITVGIAFAVVMLVMQAIILARSPRKEVLQNIRVNVNDTNRRVEMISREVDALDNRTGAGLKALGEIHGLIASGKADSELTGLVRAVAAGVSENTYRVFLELISAVETNDVGKLSGVVRSAKHLCSQYEAAHSSDFRLGERKG